jgi:hypothetical protein
MSTRVAPTEETSVRTTTTAAAERRWPLLRHRFKDDVAGTLVMAAGFFVFVTIVTTFAAYVTEVRVSGWGIGTQLVRWFVGVMGGFVTARYLPLYVAHGWTRRDAARQTAVSTASLALVVAVLVTVGFALEGLVYRLAGWPQALDGDHLFSSADQYGWILAEHALVLLVWIAAGALIGATVPHGLGTAVTLPAIFVAGGAVVVAEVVIGTGYLGPFPGRSLTETDLVPGAGGLALIVPVVLVTVAALATLTWLAVRNVAIREGDT